MLKWIAAAILALMAPVPALAWGDQGHSLTCQIAYDLMTPKTRQAVDDLLARQPAKYRNFPSACTYADDVKDNDGRRSQHFVNLHRGDRRLDGLECPVANTPTDCLLFAIRDDYEILRRPGTGDTDAKSLALMYLGHWLGDLHQPLHISYKDDIGGGNVLTTGLCGGSKLHSIWDTCIIVQRIYAARPGVAMIDDQRFIDVAQRLADAVSPAKKSAWLRGEYWDWANESYEIARKPAVKYCALHGVTCWYGGSQQTFNGGQKRSVALGLSYAADFEATVTERLQQGGARLAWMLNRVFDPA